MTPSQPSQPVEPSRQAPNTVSLADEGAVKRILLESMFSLWSTVNNLSRLRPGFELASAEDMAIPQCVDSADEAIAIIREHHAQWRSRQGV